MIITLSKSLDGRIVMTPMDQDGYAFYSLLAEAFPTNSWIKDYANLCDFYPCNANGYENSVIFGYWAWRD